ncbi:BrnT family toxin [Desulfobacula sp.]|uniref:BrnT family toxin n=1 Tax=Desulfobacula sp. TaxID=2593537 RepID=UPI001EB3B1B1|nr:BrnT family toxin [Desulfobacula sp.]
MKPDPSPVFWDVETSKGFILYTKWLDVVVVGPERKADGEIFLLLGFSQQLKILVVCNCYRSDESIIRIISARRATKKEQKVYFKRP